jgi:hypothetical protein
MKIEKKLQNQTPVECTFQPKLITNFQSQNSYVRHNDGSERLGQNYMSNIRTCPGGRNYAIKTDTFDIKETNEENLLTE